MADLSIATWLLLTATSIKAVSKTDNTVLWKKL